mmetsp:Transcript_18202/g.70358  ORF Transcript_18202/g.70358 Transcript_18202/m.70358 type:complete len:207 (-) Transcript_18202:157-777(-)
MVGVTQEGVQQVQELEDLVLVVCFVSLRNELEYHALVPLIEVSQHLDQMEQQGLVGCNAALLLEDLIQGDQRAGDDTRVHISDHIVQGIDDLRVMDGRGVRAGELGGSNDSGLPDVCAGVVEAAEDHGPDVLGQLGRLQGCEGAEGEATDDGVDVLAVLVHGVDHQQHQLLVVVVRVNVEGQVHVHQLLLHDVARVRAHDDLGKER